MRAVLVTGCSSGFGRVIAVELARSGWRVLATMRDLDKRQPLVAALNRAGVLDRVDMLQLDVTDPASVAAAAAAVTGRSDIALEAVVHNAGVAVGGAFEDLSDADIRRVMETNLFGVMTVTRALLPALRAGRGGRIVCMSSNAAFSGNPALSAYCASKWALEGWAESIRYELAQFGIDVVLIEPGPYRTGIWEASPRRLPEGSPYRDFSRLVLRYAERHVEGAARDPQEVATVVRRALEARRPRLRYPVGPTARIEHALRGKVPTRLLQAVVARVLGFDRLRATAARPETPPPRAGDQLGKVDDP